MVWCQEALLSHKRMMQLMQTIVLHTATLSYDQPTTNKLFGQAPTLHALPGPVSACISTLLKVLGDHV